MDEIEKAKRVQKLKIDKSNRLKLSLGHRYNDMGCGYHDNRPKRQRTRQSQKREWMSEE
jgi:hypothetical protein